MEQGNGEAVWLRLAEAAPQFGLSVDGLRARVRRGQVTARRGNDGRLAVAVPRAGPGPEPAPAQGMNSTGPGPEPVQEPGPPSAALGSPGLLADLLAAHERAARAEGELAGLREALATEARRSAELLAVQATERETLQAVISDLRAELTDARRGWVERLLLALRR